MNESDRPETDGSEFAGKGLEKAESERSRSGGIESEQHLFDGRFKIGAIIHLFPDSVIYEAIDTNDGQPICLKVSTQVQLQSESEKDSFLSYAYQLSQVSSPNIQRVFHYGISAKGRPYLAGEMPHGKPVANYCANLRYPKEERVCSIFAQFALALQTLHARDLCFGPINAEQLVLSDAANRSAAYLVFPGVFDLFSAMSRSTVLRDGIFPARTTPEQLMAGYCDSRSDVFSLACLLYECLKDKPFEFSSDLIHQLKTATAPDPLDVVDARKNALTQLESLSRFQYPDLDHRSPVDKVLSVALQVNPQYRYQTAIEFQDALVRALSAVGARSQNTGGIGKGTVVAAVASGMVLIGLGQLLFSPRPYMSSSLRPHYMPPPAQVTEPDLSVVPNHESAAVRTSNAKTYSASFPFSLLALESISGSGNIQGGDRYFSNSRPPVVLASLSAPRLFSGRNTVQEHTGSVPYFSIMSSQLGIPQTGESEISAVVLPSYFKKLPDAMDPPSWKKKVSALGSVPHTDTSPAVIANRIQLFQAEPDQILDLGSIRTKNGILYLGPGDYVASELNGVSIVPVPDRLGKIGPVRIFIQGDDPRLNSVLSPGRISSPDDAPDSHMLQIWYNGSGTLNFSRSSKFSGIIYAPKATLKSSGVNTFKGGIIVKRANLEGVSRFSYNPSLARDFNWSNTDLFDSSNPPPALSYAAFGIDGVNFEERSFASGETPATAYSGGFRGGTGRLGLLGSFGQVLLPTNANRSYRPMFAYMLSKDSAKIIPCPVPPSHVRKVTPTAEDVIYPKKDETIDLGNVDGLSAIHLAPGNYFADYVRLVEGQSIDIVPGKDGKYGSVRLYLRGNADRRDGLELDDGSIGGGAYPGNMQIYNISDKDITLSGNSSMRAAVYSPKGCVYMKGRSKIYGAVLAKRVEAQNDAKLYYDRALGSATNWGYKELPRAQGSQ